MPDGTHCDGRRTAVFETVSKSIQSSSIGALQQTRVLSGQSGQSTFNENELMGGREASSQGKQHAQRRCGGTQRVRQGGCSRIVDKDETGGDMRGGMRNGSRHMFEKKEGGRARIHNGDTARSGAQQRGGGGGRDGGDARGSGERGRQRVNSGAGHSEDEEKETKAGRAQLELRRRCRECRRARGRANASV